MLLLSGLSCLIASTEWALTASSSFALFSNQLQTGSIELGKQVLSVLASVQYFYMSIKLPLRAGKVVHM